MTSRSIRMIVSVTSAVGRLIAIGLASMFALPAAAQAPPVPPAQTPDAKPPSISSLTPLIAPRGTAISLVGTLPADTTVFWIPAEAPGPEAPQAYDCTQKTTESRTRLVSSPAVTSNGVTTFTALIPASLPLGNYTLCASFTGAGGAQWYTVPVMGDSGRLQVIDAPGAVPVEVTAVPRVVYEQDGGYRFAVLGNGFSRIGADNAVLLNGVELPICWNANANCVKDNSLAKGSVTSTHQLVLTIPASVQDKYPGSQTVQVRVGSNNVNDAAVAPKVTLARISKRAPHMWAAIVLVVLVLLVVLLLGTNKSEHSVAGVQLSLLSTLLLDKATDSYSLSRAQFYAWTSAALFGYTYLTVAWTYLQGRLEFAPVPQNLPGIILASAGTAVIAEGINGAKPKGAGQIQPSLADFISTGGMVVPERLQFLVWTVVGVLTFMLLVVSSDPATIATLPAIPNDFLALMGISSAGYLGGRLARKGGPIIDDILAVLGSLRLEIHGRFLSKNASFQIDGEDVTLAEIGGDDGDRDGEATNTDHLPKVVAKDDSAQDPNIAKVLAFTILAPKPDWITRKSNPSSEKQSHTLTIINPDGQKAEWKFSIAGTTALVSVTSSGKQTVVNDTLKVTAIDVVTLDASASKVEEGVPMFKWRVNGVPDATAQGPKLIKTFAVGTHRVTVEVTDAQQRFDARTVTIVVA